MQFGRIWDVLIAIVVLAGVSVAITSPNTYQDISALGNTFTTSIQRATLR